MLHCYTSEDVRSHLRVKISSLSLDGVNWGESLNMELYVNPALNTRGLSLLEIRGVGK